jgi:hypothetical protein
VFLIELFVFVEHGDKFFNAAGARFRAFGIMNPVENSIPVCAVKLIKKSLRFGVFIEHCL